LRSTFTECKPFGTSRVAIHDKLDIAHVHTFLFKKPSEATFVYLWGDVRNKDCAQITLKIL